MLENRNQTSYLNLRPRSNASLSNRGIFHLKCSGLDLFCDVNFTTAAYPINAGWQL